MVCVNHVGKVQCLLRCHARYTTRLLQLSLPTSSVDQQRGDENILSSPTAHTLAGKVKLVNNLDNLVLY